MFLLQVIELLALVGLFVQTFVAWVFVAVLIATREEQTLRGATRSFRYAFLALAGGLSLMSVRFFRAHDAASSYDVWGEGALLPVLCYGAYTALKLVFGAMLVRGSHRLTGRPVPAAFRRAVPALVLVACVLPFLGLDINALLVAQAPAMVWCALLALRGLRGARSGSGLALVRTSLVALAVSWTFHALTVVADRWLEVRAVLSMNSFVDLAVQLTLGVGIVVALVQDAQRRRVEAEQEHERLRGELQRDEKLRALGSVVSGVAHELNNPLTVVIGYAELLRRALPEESSIEIIHEQAERCRGIVRNLSALAGQSVHPRESVDLAELAGRVLRGLSTTPAARERRTELHVPAGIQVSVDRIGIEQVLSNLVTNGLHAVSPGGCVRVGAQRMDGAVELHVEDEGPGVPAEARARLFEPFFTTKSPGEGTGLGLAIAYAIVRAHGGSIRVEDRGAGPGARFVIRLPDRRPEEAGGQVPAPPAAEGAPRVMLLVDDDAAVRRILRAQAGARGWKVREAASAEEALQGSLTEADCVLCDLRMPGMGGIGLHDRLAAEGSPVLGRIVFVTGDLASDESVRFAARCGQPLVQKPFDFGELFARAEEVARGLVDGPPAVSPAAPA